MHLKYSVCVCVYIYIYKETCFFWFTASFFSPSLRIQSPTPQIILLFLESAIVWLFGPSNDNNNNDKNSMPTTAWSIRQHLFVFLLDLSSITTFRPFPRSNFSITNIPFDHFIISSKFVYFWFNERRQYRRDLVDALWTNIIFLNASSPFHYKGMEQVPSTKQLTS